MHTFYRNVGPAFETRHFLIAFLKMNELISRDNQLGRSNSERDDHLSLTLLQVCMKRVADFHHSDIMLGLKILADVDFEVYPLESHPIIDWMSAMFKRGLEKERHWYQKNSIKMLASLDRVKQRYYSHKDFDRQNYAAFESHVKNYVAYHC